MRNRFIWVPLSFLGLLVLAGVFAGYLAPYAPDEEHREHPYHPPTPIHFTDENGNLSAPFVYPTTMEFDRHSRRIYRENPLHKHYLVFGGDKLIRAEGEGRLYFFGTDSRGRDLFSRVLYGARISLSIGIAGALLAALTGLVIGSISGYFGGWIDNLLMRTAEFFIMIPAFYFLLALRSALPPKISPLHVYILTAGMLSLIGWGGVARVIRGLVLSLRTGDFVKAARVLGRPDHRIILDHIVPHTFSYLAVVITISVPSYILTESALSLLGLGIQEPFVSWGSLLSDSTSIAHLELHPWVLIPGFFIVLTAWCFNALGDQLKKETTHYE